MLYLQPVPVPDLCDPPSRQPKVGIGKVENRTSNFMGSLLDLGFFHLFLWGNSGREKGNQSSLNKQKLLYFPADLGEATERGLLSGQ